MRLSSGRNILWLFGEKERSIVKPVGWAACFHWFFSTNQCYCMGSSLWESPLAYNETGKRQNLSGDIHNLTHWGRYKLAAISQVTLSNAFLAQISIKMSLKFLRKGLINNISTLVQAKAWYLSGDKSVSEPIVVNLVRIYHSASISYFPDTFTQFPRSRTRPGRRFPYNNNPSRWELANFSLKCVYSDPL